MLNTDKTVFFLAAGAHRSGSTMQYEIIRRLLTARYQNHDHVGDRFIGDATRHPEAISLKIADQLAIASPALYKVHLRDPYAIRLWEEDRLVVWYTYRDPRSIVVSWLNRPEHRSHHILDPREDLPHYLEELERNFLFWYALASDTVGQGIDLVWKYDDWYGDDTKLLELIQQTAGVVGLPEQIRNDDQIMGDLLQSVTGDRLVRDGYIPEDHLTNGSPDSWKHYPELVRELDLDALAHKHAPIMVSHFNRE